MVYPVSPLTQNQREMWMFQVVWEVIKGWYRYGYGYGWGDEYGYGQAWKIWHVFAIPLQKQKVA